MVSFDFERRNLSDPTARTILLALRVPHGFPHERPPVLATSRPPPATTNPLEGLDSRELTLLEWLAHA